MSSRTVRKIGLGKKFKIVVVFTVKTIAVLKGTFTCTVIPLKGLFGKS